MDPPADHKTGAEGDFRCYGDIYQSLTDKPIISLAVFFLRRQDTMGGTIGCSASDWQEIIGQRRRRNGQRGK